MTVNSPPPDYYRHYFLQLLELVSGRYQDLFTEQDRQFQHAIAKASPESVRLLVRLYLRKGPLFLAEKLKYAEVSDIPAALADLADHLLIDRNPLVYAWELIELLPIAQSRKLFAEDPSIRKSDLYELWLEDETLLTAEQWGVSQTLIMPLHYDTYQRLQLLYFGNSQQDLTEFVLDDIGLFQYEAYPLDKPSRLFENIDEVEGYLSLRALRDRFYLMNEAKAWDDLDHLAEQALLLRLPNASENKRHHFINRIAYRMEQLGDLDKALTLFQTNSLAPSRERQVRILHKQGHFSQALALIETIHNQPQSAEEVQFYQRFINKLRPKLALPKAEIIKPTINNIHVQWPRGQTSVEALACQHLPGSVWLENNLPLGIFGLLHWQIIFSDVPGVWHHPFQSGPTDLYDAEFCLRRQSLLEQLYEQSTTAWAATIHQNWRQKVGIKNPFVNWKALTLDVIETCFNALTQDQWQGVFTHLLSDLKQYRSGFPDLFQCRHGQYRFIEIKGPGDKLQANQLAWLEVFAQLNIAADVCYVQYSD